MAHIISIDKAYARKMDTTEDIEKKLRRRIAKQKEIGRAIARVEKKCFKPVTNLYFTTAQGKVEYTT